MVTEEGTVAGWQDGTTAVIRVDASASEAIYKGAALVTAANVETLAAANFHNGTVDIYDKTYQPVQPPRHSPTPRSQLVLRRSTW